VPVAGPNGLASGSGRGRVRQQCADHAAGPVPAGPGDPVPGPGGGRSLAAAGGRRRRCGAHPGRGDRERPLVRHPLHRRVGARLRVRRPARRVPALPLGDPDGPRGHRLVALDRPAVVGHRAPEAALDLLDETVPVLRRVTPTGSPPGKATTTWGHSTNTWDRVTYAWPDQKRDTGRPRRGQ